VPPGQTASPADAPHMAKLETPNAMPAVTALPGAKNYRLAGLEVTPATGAPRAYQLIYIDFNATRAEAKVRSLAQSVVPELTQRDQFPQNITIDRCYIHGSDTQDVREGVAANGVAVAVVDSYISDIHDSTSDSQAIIAYRTPGPIKVVHNFLSATTEDVMFGGAGGAKNVYVPSDLEIRRNHFFKPLSWQRPGITVPPHIKWAVKNNLEFKSGQRAIVTGNVMENNWLSAQVGYSVLLTVRTAGGGNNVVVDDITIDSNILKNVDAGFNTLEHDDVCKPPNYPDCTNPGETKRVRISNNLVLLSPENNGSHHTGFGVSIDLTDTIFQHNTVMMQDGSKCWNSIFFNGRAHIGWPPSRSFTQNLAILDNVLCRQPTGDFGGQGTEGLKNYMGDPPPLDKRFTGNVMLVMVNDKAGSFPGKNSLQMKFRFADPAKNNFQLVSPSWTKTSDGKVAGIDQAALDAAMKAEAVPQPIVQPQVATLQSGQTAQFVSSAAASSWTLNPETGSVTPQGLYTAPATVADPTGVTVCAKGTTPEPECASIVLMPAAAPAR
jgi:hypothetical protein